MQAEAGSGARVERESRAPGGRRRARPPVPRASTITRAAAQLGKRLEMVERARPVARAISLAEAAPRSLSMRTTRASA